MTLFFIVWFILGAAGAFIYNSFINYENKSLKYIWSILVIVCGGVGLLLSILHWIGVKIIK